MTADENPEGPDGFQLRHGVEAIRGGPHPALGLTDLCLDYGPLRAVDHVNLTVERGEIVCLLGASGSGKSSVLRLVAGIERPSTGSVAIGGALMAGVGVPFVPPEKRAVGLVFQDFALFPHLSVLGNVTFGLERQVRGAREARGAELLERVGLAHKAREYPHTLSGGEQQRVALARALAPRPKLLLLDEPFSSLDARMRVRLRDATVDILREEGVCALFVTHDAEEAMAAGDRIALMRAGQIVQTGLPAEVYDAPVDPEAGRLFGPLNLVPARAQAGTAQSVVGAVPAPGREDGAVLWLAFRPHRAHILPASDENGALGWVQRLRPSGPDLQVLVELEGEAGAGLVEVRARRDVGLEPGAAVRIVIDPEAVMVYDAKIDGSPPVRAF